MNLEKINYLQAMGITVWQSRAAVNETAVAELPMQAYQHVIPAQTGTHSAVCNEFEMDSRLRGNDSSLQIDLQTLRQTVAACTACALHKSRTQTVFGVGNPQADLLIVGEAPGFHEDKKGEPFVGRAGQLLDCMLQAIGLNRQTVYIANILKCRPPNNRDPLPEEVNCCTPFLQQQIALIQPKLILAVGRIAAHFLLNTKTSLGQLRGKVHQFGERQTPLLITYHPAYLLRNPADKGRAFQDLQKVIEMLNGRALDKKSSA